MKRNNIKKNRGFLQSGAFRAGAWLGLHWVVGAALLLGAAPGWAQATLNGTLTITSLGLTGSPISQPAGSAIMNLSFTFGGNNYQDNVVGDLVPFIFPARTTIGGSFPFNRFYRVVCADAQAVTATTTQAGTFDRQSGTLDDLRMTFTVKHALSGGFWVLVHDGSR
jgi:hypothetical protein